MNEQPDMDGQRFYKCTLTKGLSFIIIIVSFSIASVACKKQQTKNDGLNDSSAHIVSVSKLTNEGIKIFLSGVWQSTPGQIEDSIELGLSWGRARVNNTSLLIDLLDPSPFISHGDETFIVQKIIPDQKNEKRILLQLVKNGVIKGMLGITITEVSSIALEDIEDKFKGFIESYGLMFYRNQGPKWEW